MTPHVLDDVLAPAAAEVAPVAQEAARLFLDATRCRCGRCRLSVLLLLLFLIVLALVLVVVLVVVLVHCHRLQSGLEPKGRFGHLGCRMCEVCGTFGYILCSRNSFSVNRVRLLYITQI